MSDGTSGPAKSGDTVRIHYTGTLTNGEQFDSSRDKQPIEFTLGKGQMIAGFEAAVDGMTLGERKTVTIPSDEAYGAHDPALLQEVPKTRLPPDLELKIGMVVQAADATGRSMRLSVQEIRDETVIFDANHPLAGKDLVFDIELVELEAA